MDAHTIDLEPFQYSGANITILRMVDTTSPLVIEFGEYVKKMAEEEKPAEEVGENSGGENPEEENPEAENPEEPNENPEENEESPPPDEGDENSENKEGEETKEEGDTAKEEEVFNVENIRLQTALIYDGVVLLTDTFKQLGIDQIQPTSLVCSTNGSSWEKGSSISNFMRNVKNLHLC